MLRLDLDLDKEISINRILVLKIQDLEEKNSNLQENLDQKVQSLALECTDLSEKLEEQYKNNKLLQNQIEKSKTQKIKTPKNEETNQTNHINRIEINTPTKTKTGLIDLFFGRSTFPKIVEIKDIQKQGTLHKISGWLKSWNKYFFILNGQNFYYCLSQDSIYPIGLYNIYGYSIKVEDSEKNSNKFMFSLNHTSKKSIFLLAESEQEMISWISILAKFSAYTLEEAEKYLIVSSIKNQ